MKKIFVSALLSFLSFSSFAITYTPLPLISSAGSSSGQVITSTGPTTAPAWATVTLSGLGGLAKASNLSDVASVSTSRTNLGLGTAAVVNTGTSGVTIPLLSTANTWTLAQTFTIGPVAPTATAGTNTTQLATLAFANTAAANAAAAVTPTVMTSYTPTVTATSGTFTTASATGEYYVVGKLVFFEVAVTITTVGTATGNAIVTLPFAANTSGGTQVFNGMERAITGKTLQGFVSANSTSMTIRNYDQSGVIAAGTLLVLSGVYVSN
jgi:hypothetical protein